MLSTAKPLLSFYFADAWNNQLATSPKKSHFGLTSQLTFEACEKEKHLNSTHVISGGISARLAAGLPFRSVNLLSAARYEGEKDNEIFMIDFALISIARKVKVV